MYIHVNENIRAGIDCFSPLSKGRYIVYGWLMYPAGDAVDVRVTGANDDCVVEYFSKHERPDVETPDPVVASVAGFTLVFDASDVDRSAIVLNFSSPRFSLSADLLNRGVNTDLFSGTNNRDWRATFALLGECAEFPDRLPLIRYQNRPYGVFADWMRKLPAVPSHFEHFSWLESFDATASPAGEICLLATLSTKPEKPAQIGFVAVATLRPDEYSPTEVLLPEVKARLTRSDGARTCIYGQLGAEWIERLKALELVVQITCDDQTMWFRCGVKPVSLPLFLDSLGNAPGSGRAAMGEEASLLLDDVIRSREPAFLRAVEIPEAAEDDDTAPLTGIIFDVDGVDAVRMINVARRELVALFDQIVLVGNSATQAAQHLEINGVRATADAEPSVALSTAMQGRGSVVAIGAGQFGAELIDGGLPKLLDERLSAARLLQLLTLHRVAGGGKNLAESLDRLMRFQRHGLTAEWEPLQYQWQTPAAAYLVNSHFERIWRAAMAHAE